MTFSAPAAAQRGATALAWVNGALGVLVFSGSMPATKVAVERFDPIFLTFIRASIAGAAAIILLLWTRSPWPPRKALIPLGLVALSIVLIFPLSAAVALDRMTAAHSSIMLGLLPIGTAICAVWRTSERPPLPFWIFAALGSLVVIGFALFQGGFQLVSSDLTLLVGIVAVSLGYAEGARLSRSIGGWQVISWALALSAPLMLCVTLALPWPPSGRLDFAGYVALAYVSLGSMLIGFVFWYRGLALGGIALIGQLQLLQPFLGLCWSHLFLGEHIDTAMIVAAVSVVICIAASRRSMRSAVAARVPSQGVDELVASAAAVAEGP